MHARRQTIPWTRRLSEGVSELARTPVRFAFHLAIARLLTQWRSLLTIIAGTILSASIGALVPLYTTAISQVGMIQRLAEEPAQDVHVAASISLRARDYEASGGVRQIAGSATRDITLVRVADDLGAIPDWVGEVVVYAETEGMGVLRVPDGAETTQAGIDVTSEDLEALTGVRTRLAYYAGWQDRVRIVAGRLPETNPQKGEDVEVVIGLTVANELNIDAGMVVVLDQGMSPQGGRGGGHPTSQPITARIVGVVAPVDDEDPYWMNPSPLRLLDRSTGAAPWTYQFVSLTTEDSAYLAAVDHLPDTPTKIGWRVLFAHDKLPFSEIDQAREALSIFDRNMRAAFVLTPNVAETLTVERQNLGYNYHTRLIDYDTFREDKDSGILLDYARRQELLDAPFGLLLLQIGALVLFFLMVTAALVRRGERREIAMLQSRGAWDSQIVLLRGIEALLICVLAVIIAPFLAQQLLTWLGPIVANTNDFPLPLTGRVFLFAGIAAGVTFLALIGSLHSVLRLPLVLAGGAATRSSTQHWWQKVYLDAMLAVIGLGALWLLVRRGSPLADVNLGGQQADPLMLMAPALLFLALGSLALRFFPIIAGIVARFASGSNGLLGALASWQLSREPVHYGRITFLLSLAVGIGWFATSFRATVTNSHDDQAQYRVGTDMRFVERDTSLNINRVRPAADYTAFDDVIAASTAFRVPNINLSTSIQGSLRGTILAINPDTFGETLYWRNDLGSVVMPRPPGTSPDLPERGRELPFVPVKIGLWARFDTASGARFAGDDIFHPDVARLTQRTDLALRLRDAHEAWVIVPVDVVEVEYERVGADAPGLGAGAYITSGWVYMEADLSALEYEPVAPLNLVSAYWTYRSNNPRGERGNRLTLADMTLVDAHGEVTPSRIFGDQTWEYQYDRGAEATGNAYPGLDVFERSDALYIRWDQDAQRTTIGALLNYPEPAIIDAVISRRMQEENALTWGEEASPFRILNVGGVHPLFRAVHMTDYYPSLYDQAPTDAIPQGDTFMVVDARELLYWLNRRPSATFYPDEVWMRFASGFDPRSEDDVAAFLHELDTAEAGGVVILNVVSLAEELSRLRTDPLSLGLLGLMYLAFVMALVLSMVGLLTYAGLTAQSRRTDFGVLRALGLSSLRVVGGLALEQLFVMIIGATLGAVLGWVLASQVVPTLALGAAGEGITPPFVMRVESRRLIEYALLMVGVFGLVLASSLLLVRQLSLARTLRLGEE